MFARAAELLCLFLYISTKVCFTSAVDLTASLRMAQCRAHCLNKYADNPNNIEKSCRGTSDCYNMCWQTCEKLSVNYPIWSINCGHATRCNAGCQSACQFLNSRREDAVVPLSPYKSRLTLIFGGTSAQWSLVWGADVPSQKAVFALFTRSTGKPWKLRLQTSESGALLDDVVTGTELKLVAVAESGLLSVIITPFEPSNVNRKGLSTDERRKFESVYPWNKDNVVRGDKERGWPLLYQASVQDSGLVAAKVWWSTQRPLGSDYLVTWEVAGGGLKGHLYTDLPEVELKLWPKTVYKVQVEVVSGPLGEPRISQLLILDTNNITATAVVQPQKIVEQPKEDPSVKLIDDPKMQFEIIIGVALGALAAFVVIITLICRNRQRLRSTFNDSSSSNSKLTLNRSITDLNVDETLVRTKGDLLEASPKLPTKSYSIYPVPYPAMESQNTLGIPSSQNVYINIHSSSLRNPHLKPRVSIIYI